MHRLHYSDVDQRTCEHLRRFRHGGGAGLRNHQITVDKEEEGGSWVDVRHGVAVCFSRSFW